MRQKPISSDTVSILWGHLLVQIPKVQSDNEGGRSANLSISVIHCLHSRVYELPVPICQWYAQTESLRRAVFCYTFSDTNSAYQHVRAVWSVALGLQIFTMFPER